MPNRPWFPVALVLVAAALGAALGPGLGALGGDRGEFGHFDSARAVHLAPDGRLIFADLGTGHDDGRVVAVRPGGQQQTLMDGLPSTDNSGQAYSALSGPSGAAMNEAGVTCAVIGDGPTAGFAAMTCTNSLTVALKAFERAQNPDGRALESNPYDIVSDGEDGWVVSDAAANSVLHISATGEIEVLAVFWPEADGQPEGIPTGLDFKRLGALRVVSVALFGGGFAVLQLGGRAPSPDGPEGRPAVASSLNAYARSAGETQVCLLEWDSVDHGGDLVCDRQHVRSFERPTGLAQTAPREFVVIADGQPKRISLDD